MDMSGCRPDSGETSFCAERRLPDVFAVYASVFVSLLCMYNYPALNSQSDMSGHRCQEAKSDKQSVPGGGSKQCATIALLLSVCPRFHVTLATL